MNCICGHDERAHFKPLDTWPPRIQACKLIYCFCIIFRPSPTPKIRTEKVYKICGEILEEKRCGNIPPCPYHPSAVHRPETHSFEGAATLAEKMFFEPTLGEVFAPRKENWEERFAERFGTMAEKYDEVKDFIHSLIREAEDRREEEIVQLDRALTLSIERIKEARAEVLKEIEEEIKTYFAAQFTATLSVNEDKTLPGTLRAGINEAYYLAKNIKEDILSLLKEKSQQ